MLGADTEKIPRNSEDTWVAAQSSGGAEATAAAAAALCLIQQLKIFNSYSSLCVVVFSRNTMFLYFIQGTFHLYCQEVQ